MIHPESARLSEDELRQRMRKVILPNPLIHVGPAYPIQTFEHWDNPYPGYYHGAVVVVDSWLGEEVWVEERAQTMSS
jgi:hypothetical protein